MPFLLRLLTCATVAAVIGVAAPATAQLRSWQQGSRAAAPRSAPQPTIVGRPAAPQTVQPASPPQAVAPQPAASPWLPTTEAAPRTTTSARRSPQTGVVHQAVRPNTHYPLPGAAPAPQPTMPAQTAVLGAPQATPQTSNVARGNVAAISPYAAAYLASQQPTPAPPLTGPTNTTGPAYAAPVMQGAPGMEGGSPWTLPGLPATGTPSMPISMPTPSPASSGGPFDMLGSSCDPEEMLDPAMNFEDPGDPAIPMVAPRGCGPWFFSVSGLILSRGVPNNVELTSSSAVPQTSILNTERVGTDDWIGGVEFRFGRTIGDRWALEFGYWSTEAQSEQVSVRDLNNGLDSRLDFDNISYQGAPLSTVFDDSREQRFFRSWSAESIEINLLQQALMVDPIDRYGMTMFSGVRYLRFDELWHYEAAAANSEFADHDPATQSNYWIYLKNRMVGWQLGGRGHVRLGNRVRLFAMPRFAVMGTRIGQQQHVCMIIDQHATKCDVALLGQLDFGVSVQVLRCFSIFGSYRAMGISGVAVGDDNVTRTFTSPAQLESINSSSALILHGWQVGAQWQF